MRIPRIDSRQVEEWNKFNPKIGYEESKIIVAKVGKYGNYNLRDKLMELINYLLDPFNVVVVAHGDTQYFKQLETQILEIAKEMVNML